MCGIAGLYNFDLNESVSEVDLKRMARVLAHRGPNNEGVFAHHNAGLSYRRLSIIDTTEQEQPILTNEDRSLRISFNGEIYNFPELKKKLLERGHRFYTATDTEMLLHLYEEEGFRMLGRLNGIFALAILDLRRNELFLARDQMGIKPLYYVQDERRFAFASEIKALLKLPWVKREVNFSALPLYFKYRFVPDPLTMFKGIKKLKPGHWMKVSLSGVERQQYFSLRENLEIRNPKLELQDEKQAIEQVRETVMGSVERQLLSDVPLGAFLSGGVDSSIIVGVMSKLLPEPVKTFSIGFSESKFDELYYARQLAQKFGTDHHEMTLKPEHIRKLPEIVYYLDEPLADPAVVPTYFLSQMASKEVRVVLTGEGGDELFAGYKEDFNYRLGNLLDNLLGDRLSTLRIESANLVGRLPDLLRGKTRLFRSLLPQRVRAEHILRDLFRFEDLPLEKSILNPQGLEWEFPWSEVEGFDWLTKMLYLESKIWLPGDPLMKVDKMTMSHGLEARVPLLDMEVVRLAASLPSGLKNKGGVEKYLLRKAFKDFLPEKIFGRRKQAFELPLADWLSGELSGLVKEYVLGGKVGASRVLNPQGLRKIVKMHRGGKHDYKYEIWAILNFELWYERWFG